MARDSSVAARARASVKRFVPKDHPLTVKPAGNAHWLRPPKLLGNFGVDKTSQEEPK